MSPDRIARKLGSEKALGIALIVFAVAQVICLAAAVIAVIVGFQTRTTVNQVVHPSDRQIKAGIDASIAKVSSDQVKALLLKLTPREATAVSRALEQKADQQQRSTPTTTTSPSGGSRPPATRRPGPSPRANPPAATTPQPSRPPATTPPAPAPTPQPTPPAPTPPPPPGPKPICVLDLVCLPPLR